MALIISATLSICAIVIVITLVVQRKRQMEEAGKEEEGDKWEIKREDVVIGAELGSGCFGTVYKGTLKDSRQVY